MIIDKTISRATTLITVTLLFLLNVLPVALTLMYEHVTGGWAALVYAPLWILWFMSNAIAYTRLWTVILEEVKSQ